MTLIGVGDGGNRLEEVAADGLTAVGEQCRRRWRPAPPLASRLPTVCWQHDSCSVAGRNFQPVEGCRQTKADIPRSGEVPWWAPWSSAIMTSRVERAQES